MPIDIDYGPSLETDTAPAMVLQSDFAQYKFSQEFSSNPPGAFGPSTYLIEFKSGLDANLPSSFRMAEPAFTTDSSRMFVGLGVGTGRVEVPTYPLGVVASAQTTDATATTVGEFTLADNTVYLVEAHVVGRATSGGSSGGGIAGIHAATCWRTGGGGATLGGSPTSIHFGIDPGLSGVSVTINASGNNVRVRVVGLASTNINWKTTLWVRKLTS